MSLFGERRGRVAALLYRGRLRSLRMAMGKDEQDRLKMEVAQRALGLVEPGMTVGLGSGSTATIWIRLLGEKVRDGGLKIRAIASSEDSERLGRSYGIPFTTFEETK